MVEALRLRHGWIGTTFPTERVRHRDAIVEGSNAPCDHRAGGNDAPTTLYAALRPFDYVMPKDDVRLVSASRHVSVPSAVILEAIVS